MFLVASSMLSLASSRGSCLALLTLIATVCGCQEKPLAQGDSKEATPVAGQADKVAGEVASKVEVNSPATYDPDAVADDGTVLLTPPAASVATGETKMDIGVDTSPVIPADAKYGEPTLADAAKNAPADIILPTGPALSGTTVPSDSPGLALSSPTESPESAEIIASARPASAESATADAAQLAPVGNLATADELNQKVAEDWPKPQAVLFLTGQQHGYLEPCGCTGLDRQKGGIIRRDTLVTQLRDRGWPVVPLDVGNQVRRTGRQAEIQFRVTANAFKTLGYKAVTLGFDDLHLNSSGLVQVAASDDVVKNPGMFISANTSIYDSSFWPTAQVVEVGGRKIGITAYLGAEFQGELSGNKDIAITDAATALQKVVGELKSKGCDYLVLLAHANQYDSEQMAAKVPGFDLVVTAGGLGEPRNVLDPIPGSSAMISQVGTKGMFACIVGLFDDKENPVRYQRIAISSQFQDSPRMLETFKQYQEQLQSDGFEGLGVKFKTAPKLGEFVGSESCGDCHTTAFDIWKDSKHFHATDSIVTPPNDRGAIPRHFDPECVSCHVTGWDPQKFEPFETGYWSLEKTPKLVGSGCENCHGPGSEHVAAENDSQDSELINRLREQMRLPLKMAEAKCVECHDTDNSPEFNFKDYWEEVKHIGKD